MAGRQVQEVERTTGGAHRAKVEAIAVYNMSRVASPTVQWYEGPGYQPLIPQSYAGCVFNPNDPGSFDLLTPNALPIINRNGRAVEETDPNAQTRPYTFYHSTNAPPGLFDIRTTNAVGPQLFLAVFGDRRVGWVERSSSEGQTPVGSPPNDDYITSIWSVQCNGLATAGIIGGIQFKFQIDDRGSISWTGYLPPKTPPRDRKDVDALGFFVKPVELVTPPPGTGCISPQIPVIRNPAVPEACNIHDQCWSTCGNYFEECNYKFLDNLMNLCAREFSRDRKALTGCVNLAEVYFLRAMSQPSSYLYLEDVKKYCVCTLPP
ncbi:hypothetical protein QBC44DRAFT_340905 [Cladorrhinum sp. PSN332]|nr:hypothetical protein QBC44DRAFT_340905 [Cladorrhinum sp. PSN332]